MKKRAFAMAVLASMMLLSACGKKEEMKEGAEVAKEVAEVVKDAASEKAEEVVKDAIEQVAPGSTIKREDYVSTEEYLFDLAVAELGDYSAPLRYFHKADGTMVDEGKHFYGEEWFDNLKYRLNEETKEAICVSFNRTVFEENGIDTLTIPAEVNGYNVVAVNLGSGKAVKQIKKVVIEDGIREIYDSFFRFEDLEEVIIPDSVNFITAGCFDDCKSLKNVTLPENLRWLDGFRYSVLDTISVPEHVVYLSGFEGSELSEIVFEGEELQAVAGDAFCKCQNLTSLELPDSVYAIGTSFLNHSAITEFTVPASFANIDSSMHGFWGHTLQETPYAANYEGDFIIWNDVLVCYCGDYESDVITIPDNVKIIPEDVFAENREIKEVIVPEGVEVLQARCFAELKGLKKVTLPSTISQLGEVTVDNMETKDDGYLSFAHSGVVISITGENKLVEKMCEDEPFIELEK